MSPLKNFQTGKVKAISMYYIHILKCHNSILKEEFKASIFFALDNLWLTTVL